MNNRAAAPLKKIKLREQKLEVAADIAREFGIAPIAARVLAARGFLPGDELKNYLEPDMRRSLPGPALLKGLEDSVKLVIDAVRAHDKIAICCDFDVDGLSGGAEIHQLLTSVGAQVNIFVPCRFSEGYGLSEKIVKEIVSGGFKLAICVDFGTTNIREIAALKSAGIKTVIIDHHQVDAIPPADAFVNPNQPGCRFKTYNMSAAGLCWYFVIAFKQLWSGSEIEPKDYADLACLGTICDMVPLIGPNRVIAQKGLSMLNKTKRVGLQALIKTLALKKAVSCSEVSFGIGPRINAAGRLSSGAKVAELLTTSDSIIAGRIADELNSLNSERKNIEESVRLSALERLASVASSNEPIVVADPAFHTGVVGIVAQRLVEHFYRPVVVLGMDEPGIYKGSVRGIKGFNVVNSLSAVGEWLVKFGGHEGAGGLSVTEENLERFATDYKQHGAEMLVGLELLPTVYADVVARFSELNATTIQALAQFEPFGIGNSTPQFLFEKIQIRGVKQLNGGHLKLTLSDGQHTLDGLMWKTTSHPAAYIGNTVSVVGKPEINSFSGADTMQVVIAALG